MPDTALAAERLGAAAKPPKYMDAITAALDDAMAQADEVVVMGIDVGAGNGVYGITRGLHDRYGAQRVLDTPIAEAGVLGAAVGAALAGLRPVVEIMYMDFITVCLDPIVNQAAKLRYMTGGGVRVPIVFRTQTGSGHSAGAQHSQSLEVLLAHVPGLQVYCPSDARDAYDLLRDAIALDSPVCFIENRRLYGKRDPQWDRPALPAGRVRVVRPGRDLTVIAWGRMVGDCEAAAAEVADEFDVEVLDLRTLVPLDQDGVLESVRRTGACLVVHDAVTRFGPGSEVAALVADLAFPDLDGPVRRLGAAATPTPYSPPLEKAMFPDTTRIVAAIRDLLR